MSLATTRNSETRRTLKRRILKRERAEARREIREQLEADDAVAAKAELEDIDEMNRLDMEFYGDLYYDEERGGWWL